MKKTSKKFRNFGNKPVFAFNIDCVFDKNFKSFVPKLVGLYLSLMIFHLKILSNLSVMP